MYDLWWWYVEAFTWWLNSRGYSKVVKFSYDKDNQIRRTYPINKPLIDRLNTINKYIKFNDGEYLEGLKEE